MLFCYNSSVLTAGPKFGRKKSFNARFIVNGNQISWHALRPGHCPQRTCSVAIKGDNGSCQVEKKIYDRRVVSGQVDGTGQKIINPDSTNL